MLSRQKEDFIDKLSEVQRCLADRDLEIEAMGEQLVDKERAITERDQTIAERDSHIQRLQAEIDRLNGVISQNGMAANDLQGSLGDLQQKLREAE